MVAPTVNQVSSAPEPTPSCSADASVCASIEFIAPWSDASLTSMFNATYSSTNLPVPMNQTLSPLRVEHATVHAQPAASVPCSSSHIEAPTLCRHAASATLLQADHQRNCIWRMWCIVMPCVGVAAASRRVQWACMQYVARGALGTFVPGGLIRILIITALPE